VTKTLEIVTNVGEMILKLNEKTLSIIDAPAEEDYFRCIEIPIILEDDFSLLMDSQVKERKMYSKGNTMKTGPILE